MKLFDNLFTKVTDLSHKSNRIGKAADHLLSRVVPEEVAEAICQTTACSGCIFGKKVCHEVCCGWTGCSTKVELRNC